MNGFTFDAGGLIAIDRKDRRILALVDEARRSNQRLSIPATALAQTIRRPASQASLSRLMNYSETDVITLDREDAMAIGRLLAQTGTSDVVDAHVVVCAMRAGQPVITSDAGDLRRLAPSLQLISV